MLYSLLSIGVFFSECSVLGVMECTHMVSALEVHTIILLYQ